MKGKKPEHKLYLWLLLAFGLVKVITWRIFTDVAAWLLLKVFAYQLFPVTKETAFGDLSKEENVEIQNNLCQGTISALLADAANDKTLSALGRLTMRDRIREGRTKRNQMLKFLKLVLLLDVWCLTER